MDIKEKKGLDILLNYPYFENEFRYTEKTNNINSIRKINRKIIDKSPEGWLLLEELIKTIKDYDEKTLYRLFGKPLLSKVVEMRCKRSKKNPEAKPLIYIDISEHGKKYKGSGYRLKRDRKTWTKIFLEIQKENEYDQVKFIYSRYTTSLKKSIIQPLMRQFFKELFRPAINFKKANNINKELTFLNDNLDFKSETNELLLQIMEFQELLTVFIKSKPKFKLLAKQLFANYLYILMQIEISETKLSNNGKLALLYGFYKNIGLLNYFIKYNKKEVK